MYVKCFDTVMLYYVISEFSESHFLSFSNFPPVPSPVRPDARRGRNPEDRCRHLPEDTAGGTSWQHRTS
ncbi:unnamed protein product [Staurois parvus]|uniref:Uncharacterized protein n=1 Tax=Staurois parvus TaxID=386267 RepID=A0ABN9GAP7_9NEOB|nr:unnamed protein product [Staurois parvus]